MAILATFAMADDETSARDRSRLSVFVQPAVSFLDFPEREYFQNAIDTLYYSFKENALTESESLNVAKQDFQKVNFCFPVTAGLQYQVFPDNFVSAGIGYIYDNESVVLTDRKNRTHNYSYTIQGIPLFLEYRLGIPRNLMTLSGESLFSIAVRWYWVLPGTEIYTTWGSLDAKTPALGSGFGVSIGYLIANWKNFNIYGDIGFSNIKVESDRKYSDIVPDGLEEKAKWNIGGLTMQVRIGFGLWNEPEPVEESDDDDGNVPPAETTESAPSPQGTEKAPDETGAETASSEAVTSEAASPETAQPETAKPDTATPETETPETAEEPTGKNAPEE